MASAAFISKNAGPEAARIAGNSAEMDVIGGRVLRAARIVAAAHRDSGNYVNGLEMHRVPSQEPSRVGFVDDRVVTSTDPATLSIEHGHLQRVAGARRVRWIPGQHILGRAMGMVR